MNIFQKERKDDGLAFGVLGLQGPHQSIHRDWPVEEQRGWALRIGFERAPPLVPGTAAASMGVWIRRRPLGPPHAALQRRCRAPLPLQCSDVKRHRRLGRAPPPQPSPAFGAVAAAVRSKRRRVRLHRPPPFAGPPGPCLFHAQAPPFAEGHPVRRTLVVAGDGPRRPWWHHRHRERPSSS